MLTATMLLCTIGAAQPDVPTRMELFAREGWYKEQAGKEQDFVGVLKKVDGGGLGIGRFNPNRLDMGKESREVYVGGKPAILGPYVGKRVKLIGKPVELEVVGRVHNEIWPASIETVGEGGADKEKAGAFPILARGVWPFGSTDPDMREKASQFVIRSAAELTARPPFSNLDALPAVVEKMATEQLAKILKVPNIDWKSQMLIVVTGGTQSSGGYRIGVTKMRKDAEALVVEWFLQPPTGVATDAFTHPAEVVLTNRHEGKVEFRMVRAGEKEGPIKKRPVERLPLKDDKSDEPAKVELKVHGQVRGNGIARAHAVIRSAEDLAKARGRKDVEQVSAELAKTLKVGRSRHRPLE